MRIELNRAFGREIWLLTLATLPAWLLAAACGSAADDTGGFGGNFTYGDGGGYQGTTIAVAVSGNASSAVSTVSVTSVTSTVATSTSSGPVCNDSGPGEPNDTIGQAYNLGQISDSDGDGGQVQGTMSSAADIDWYKYHGVDLTGNIVDPTRQILSAGVRICKYIQCDNGEANDFTCPASTMADTASGHPGCCWMSSAPVTLDLTCGSTALDSDNATVFIRIDNPGALFCQAYTMQYHY